MVLWSESIRESDPDIFLRLAIEQTKADLEPVWILTDARRPTDLRFFQAERFAKCKIFRVKIRTTIETRTARGWIFTAGIDDKTTECGLDEHNDWDLIIDNNDLTIGQLLEILKEVIDTGNSAQ